MGNAKTPRLDKYTKLTARTYEILFLLQILRPVPGPHVVPNHDSTSQTATRRRFLTNLSFLCDYTKGGDSVACVAVEDDEDYYTFWISSNEEPGPKVVGFLEAVLAKIKRSLSLRESSRQASQESLTEHCAKFADEKIKREAQMLSNAAKDVQAKLQKSDSGVDSTTSANLSSWLQTNFPRGRRGLPLCRVAYDVRLEPSMGVLQTLAREPVDGSMPSELSKDCKKLRHYIGRLAEHIRVPKQLLQDARFLVNVFSEYRVEKVPAPVCVQPSSDAQTYLGGIIKRGCLESVESILQKLDASTHLEEKILSMYAKYEDGPATTRVHAEIQMLEHFTMFSMKFWENDAYIACSKLACFCCRLYFRHHETNVVEPASHGKAYQNWGLISLPEGSKDPGFFDQLKILNKFNTDIRGAVKHHLMHVQNSGHYHHNSVTNITEHDSGLQHTAIPYEEDEDTTPASSDQEALDGLDNLAIATDAADGQLQESQDEDNESDGGAIL